MHKMFKVARTFANTDVRICVLVIVSLCCITKGESYFVTLSDNGPVVLGANITFKAELFTYYGSSPSGSFRFRWKDNAIPQHTSKSEGSGTIAYWNVSYPSPMYGPGPYEVEVIVDESAVFFWPVSSQRISFNITALLNGKMTLVQSNHVRENEFVSSAEQVTHRIDLTSPDGAFLAQDATSILTYWFVDCIYYGQTPGYAFNFNYSQPGKAHHVEALVVASYDPPATTTTTTTTTSTTTPAPTSSTAAPNSTTTTTAKSPSMTTNDMHSNTTISTTTSVTTSMPPPKNMSFEINSNDINSAIQMFPVENTSIMPIIAPGINITNSSATNHTLFFPYVCLNSSIVPPDPNKTYGYFHRKLFVKAPVANVSVVGTNWLQHGDMLNLQVMCNGTSKFDYCYQIYSGVYNVTGNETCATSIRRTDCQFPVVHYFREPSQYTVVIIIKNDVSKVVSKVGINIYEVTKHAQLSVIVVPVTCSLMAVILIVFGVALYVQNRNRYIVEVADFDFGQVNDMEYKTFRERLRESISNAVTRVDFPEPSSSRSPTRKYGPMN